MTKEGESGLSGTGTSAAGTRQGGGGLASSLAGESFARGRGYLEVSSLSE